MSVPLARVNPRVLKEVDEIREDIPRSHIIERALIRYVNDVKEGRVSLLQGAYKVATPTAHQAEQDSSMSPTKEAHTEAIQESPLVV